MLQTSPPPAATDTHNQLLHATFQSSSGGAACYTTTLFICPFIVAVIIYFGKGIFIYLFFCFISIVFFSTPKVINSFLSCGTREENGKERNSRNQTTRQTKAYGHQWFIAFFSLSSLFFSLFLRNPLTLHYSIYSVRTHWQWEGGGSSKKKKRRRFTILGAKAKVLDCLRFVF